MIIDQTKIIFILFIKNSIGNISNMPSTICKKFRPGMKSLSSLTISLASIPPDEFGRDITKLAREGKLDPVIGREDEIERLIQILSRRTKNNPVLIGEPGVGKTAIVEGLAQRIFERTVPLFLSDKRIIGLDLGLLVAGTKYRGQFEERMKAIMHEILEAKNCIIFIIR